jgi:very-short-patch-repair endonuclease
MKASALSWKSGNPNGRRERSIPSPPPGERPRVRGMVTQTTVSSRKTQSSQRVFARAMRHGPMDAERKFWWRVCDRRLGGYKFKRLFLIGRYIVDFVCLEHSVIVELDGGQHALQISYDRVRGAFLKAPGFHVLRFWNDDVLTNMDGVPEGVLMVLRQSPSPLPSPPKGERE